MGGCVDGVEDLDLERIARGGVRGMLGPAIATGAGGEGTEQINLCAEFNVIAGADGRGFHEILPGVAGEAGTHENIEDVVDVGFGLMQGDLRDV